MTTKQLKPIGPAYADQQLCAIDTIHFNPWQMWPLDPAHVAELAADIRENGVLQPPLARPHPDLPGHVQLAFGHHRRAGAAEAGLAEMLVNVRPISDLEMADYAIVENFKRRTPTTLDKARGLARLTGAPFNLTQAEAGRRFGLSQAAVANLLRLLKLPAELHADIESGALPERIARQLVTVSGLAPKRTAELAKEIAAAEPGERDEVLTNGLDDILDHEGRGMRAPAFPLDFAPAGLAADGLPLRACRGCPDMFQGRWENHCTRPACFDAKVPLGQQAALEAAIARTQLPAADAGESTSAINDDYKHQRYLDALIKAGRKEDALGLRLVTSAQTDRRYHNWEDLTGSTFIGVETVNPKAVVAWFATKLNGNANGAGKSVVLPPAPADPEKPETPAQKAKREAAEAAAKKAERAAADERRRERGVALKSEADVVWLVQNFAEVAAPQLTISGHTLLYAVNFWIGRGMGRGRAAMYEGLREWYDGLESQAEQAGQGKDADALRRQLVVAAEIFEHCLGQFGDKQSFAGVIDDLADLAAGDKDEPGLGVKLPAGWNKPPIHKTEGNCWHCGRFASQRGKLTQAEVEAGWGADYKGETVLSVNCPDCKSKPAPKAAAAKPAAKPAKKGGKK